VLRVRHKRRPGPLAVNRYQSCPSCRSLHPTPRRGRMRRSVLVALLALAAACRERPEVAGPRPAAPRLQASVLDPALSAALASAAPTASLEVIANYDETLTTRDAVSNAMLDLGAGVVTFKGPAPKPLKQGLDIFAENLPNSETSVGHGTHVAGIAAALGSASSGYYTGVAPGANLMGVGTGDILFIFFALAGFDYILEHQKAYNIQVVNNSWGTSGAFDPKDPINKASKTVHDHGITVVFAAGNEGPDQNTLNPYSVAPWVIGVAAGCKLVSPDPTNSAIHCDDPTGQNRAPILADFSSRGIPKK